MLEYSALQELRKDGINGKGFFDGPSVWKVGRKNLDNIQKELSIDPICGICGKAYFDSHPKEELSLLVKRMNEIMNHRGPDDEGYYISDTVGLGHKRLSTIDLSSGKQPIFNEDGSIVVIFNGEINNYKSLRRDLQECGHVFRTQSDTEVIVHLYEVYGEGFLEYLRGMFAIARWNDNQKMLILARDRLEIKPSYFSSNLGSLVFASEVKAILADKEFGLRYISSLQSLNFPIGGRN